MAKRTTKIDMSLWRIKNKSRADCSAFFMRIIIRQWRCGNRLTRFPYKGESRLTIGKP